MPALFNFLRLGLLLSLTTSVLGDDGDTWTEPADELPSWASENSLQLKLSADSTNYAVIPLTEKLALGNTHKATSNVGIKGTLKAVHDTNFNKFTGNDDVAYMSCDEPEEATYIDPNKMLNELMKQTPLAIVLFSTSSNWCSLHYNGDLAYTSILSMVDPGEATTVLNHLNQTDKGEIVDVAIYGNTTNVEPGDDSKHSSQDKSAVAMSVLYSITGLITFLFLVIIITGAVRAHRYPERYGPRSGVDGGPGQSRAKGLARAVLETIPIRKFGSRHQAKPDPDLEMDTATTEGQYPTAAGLESAQATGAGRESGTIRSTRLSMSGSDVTGTSVMESEVGDENLGCSICTEDFKVGEDVRVLPCNHQYHPTCVDPWLINVSGTCPLCRLDLRPGHDKSKDGAPTDEETQLPPPLGVEMSEQEADHSTPRNRLSRLFDVNRLRQASVEEQMQALRQLREHGLSQTAPEAEPQNAGAGATSTTEQHQGPGFADKLRTKFRILTKSQAGQRETCAEGQQRE